MTKSKMEGLKHVLFFDIETATVIREFHGLPERMKKEWEKKSNRFAKLDEYPLSEDEVASFYQDKASIFAEYARVVCISMGLLTADEHGNWHLRIKSLYDEDESALLQSFADLLNKYYFDRTRHALCGHNIREFDVPFLCRRFVIHRLPLPDLLDISGQRSWHLNHLLDTLELWKFGDYKHYTSLDLMCAIFDIPSPKNELSGDKVSHTFWEGNLEDIVRYCERDLVATVRVYLRCINIDIELNLDTPGPTSTDLSDDEEE